MHKSSSTALDLFVQRPQSGFLTGLKCLDKPLMNRRNIPLSTIPNETINNIQNQILNHGFQSRQIIELCGDTTLSIVSLFMMIIAQFSLRYLNKSNHNEHKIKDIVYIFDHECEMNPELMYCMLNTVLNKMEDTEINRENLIYEAMSRIKILHCHDTFQFVATLNSLHFQLLEQPQSSILLVINSIDSFYAIDQMMTKKIGSGAAMTEQVFVVLKEFIRHHAPIVFVSRLNDTRVTLTQSTPRNIRNKIDRLPSAWSSQVSKQYIVRVRTHSTKQMELEVKLGGRSESIAYIVQLVVDNETRMVNIFEQELVQ